MDSSRVSMSQRMDNWGKTPVVGVFSGTGRVAYGVIKLGVGLVGMLANVVIDVVKIIFAQHSRNDRFRTTREFACEGASNVWKGLREVGSLGCHEKIKAAIQWICQPRSKQSNENPYARVLK